MYKIPAKTLFIGKNLIFLPTCHSTNEQATDLLNKDRMIEGTVVITNNQTAGKGQRGNTWTSEPGKNLTYSLILKPSFLPIVHQFYLNIIISLGITDYLNTIKNGFQVKWPNDIYFEDKKICGILIETTIMASRINYAVIGIGLNINQQQFTDARPVSLAMITGETYNLNEVFEQLNQHLESRYMQLKRGETTVLQQDYIKNMYWYGEDHLFRAGEVFQGRITGITDNGLLEIETRNGLERFSFKEVEFVRMEM